MKTVVYTFGRMNPPTRGHERLVTKVVETARELDADHVIFLSQTQRAPTDPLEWSFKRRICEAAFPGVWISDDKTIRNPFQALERLKEEYEQIILVAGSDQVEDYKKFSSYVSDWEVGFTVVSAGTRVQESKGIAGISASKLRQYAAEGKKEKFLEGLPKTINSNVKEIVYRNTIKGMRVPKTK